jgi:plastocyanin
MTTTTTDGTRARWSTLASTGFILAGAGPLLQLIAVLVFGLSVSDAIPFLLPPVVVSAIGAMIARRSATWTKGIAVFLALALAFFASFGISELTLPESFFNFLPELMLLLGGLAAFVAGIAAIVAGRRGHLGTAADGGEALAMKGAMIVVLAAAMISAVLTFASHSNVSGAGAAAIARMKDAKFVPTVTTVAGGRSIYVRNDDPIAHTFTVDALSLDVKFGPKDSKVIALPAKPGTYVFYCRYHTSNKEHPTKDDMAGTLTVS